MDADRDARIRLEAGGCAVEVAPGVGGRIAALEVDGWDVLRRDGWTDREWGSFVMAPWAGRLRDARVAWGGRTWVVPATERRHALHGTVLDVPWAVAASDPTSVTLETGFGPAWPFEASIRRRIELHPDRVVDTLAVTASGPMPRHRRLAPVVPAARGPPRRERRVGAGRGRSGRVGGSSSTATGCRLGAWSTPGRRRSTTCSSTSRTIP